MSELPKNYEIRVFMNPQGSMKEIPELGYAFPTGKSRTIVVSEQDYAEFQKRLAKTVPDPRRRNSGAPGAPEVRHRVAHYEMELVRETTSPVTPKIKQIGWKRQPVRKSPLEQQTEALKQGFKDLGDQFGKTVTEALQKAVNNRQQGNQPQQQGK